MPGRRMYGELPTLPPQEFWTDPSLQKNSLETPLDERLFVDMDGLVELGRQFIVPEFQWESPVNDVHHLQWSISTQIPENMSTADYKVLKEFRELVNRKMYTPRVFHNWLHWLTVPPSVPGVEQMRYSVDAQRVAVSLAKTAALATQLTRIKAMPEKELNRRLEEEFINYNLYMENARLVPVEFRTLKLEELEVRSPEDLLVVNKQLGRMAVNAMPVRIRSVRTVPAAA